MLNINWLWNQLKTAYKWCELRYLRLKLWWEATWSYISQEEETSGNKYQPSESTKETEASLTGQPIMPLYENICSECGEQEWLTDKKPTTPSGYEPTKLKRVRKKRQPSS